MHRSLRLSAFQRNSLGVELPGDVQETGLRTPGQGRSAREDDLAAFCGGLCAGVRDRWGLVDELCDRPDTRILSPSLRPPQTHSPAWATDVLRLADQNQLAFRYHPSPFLTFTSSLTNYT